MPRRWLFFPAPEELPGDETVYISVGGEDVLGTETGDFIVATAVVAGADVIGWGEDVVGWNADVIGWGT